MLLKMHHTSSRCTVSSFCFSYTMLADFKMPQLQKACATLEYLILHTRDIGRVKGTYRVGQRTGVSEWDPKLPAGQTRLDLLLRPWPCPNSSDLWIFRKILPMVKNINIFMKDFCCAYRSI